MIGWLQGIILEKKPPKLLLNVNGVGYMVKCSMTTYYQLPEVHTQATLYTHFVVREDAQELYGFHDTAERDLFRHLIRVNGVGPKLALSILSSVSSADFIRCVSQQDSASLVKIPGIGKKTAERLIIEMRDKLKELISDMPQSAVSDSQIHLVHESTPVQDAMDALLSLGYKNHEAQRVLAGVKNQNDLSSEQIIREALKSLRIEY